MKREARRIGARVFALCIAVWSLALLVGCGTWFDPEEAEKRRRQKERENGYRSEETRWEKWKEWERVKYRDWFRRMTDD